jgi:hypothetical protein
MLPYAHTMLVIFSLGHRLGRQFTVDNSAFTSDLKDISLFRTQNSKSAHFLDHIPLLPLVSEICFPSSFDNDNPVAGMRVFSYILRG